MLSDLFKRENLSMEDEAMERCESLDMLKKLGYAAGVQKKLATGVQVRTLIS